MAEEPRSKIPKFDQDSEDFTSSFASPWHRSDVVLVIEGHKFHVHKCILSMNSPVFERMFSPESKFIEKSSEEIELPGKSAKEFEVLLRLLYSDNVRSLITYGNFEFLIKFADEYQMSKIKKHCADFMKLSISKYNCLHFCRVANDFNVVSIDLESEQDEDETEAEDRQVRDKVVQTINRIVEMCVDKAKWLSLSSIDNSEHFAQISSTSSKLAFQILREKIKVLEKYEDILAEYHSTCCYLITTIYKLAADAREKACQDFPKCYNYHHNSKETRDKFVFDCFSCILWLENNWPKSKPYKVIEQSIKKLHSLQKKYVNIGYVPRGFSFGFRN